MEGVGEIPTEKEVVMKKDRLQNYLKEHKKRLSLIWTASLFSVDNSPLFYQPQQKTSLEVQESLQLTVDR